MASGDKTPSAPTRLHERRPDLYAAAATTPVPDVEPGVAYDEPHPGIIAHTGTIEVNAQLSKILPPVPNPDLAQRYDLSCLNGVKFQPCGDAAADAAAWQDFIRTLRGHVPCVKLLAIDGGIRGHEVAMAFLLQRIFDLTLHRAARRRRAARRHAAHRGAPCASSGSTRAASSPPRTRRPPSPARASTRSSRRRTATSTTRSARTSRVLPRLRHESRSSPRSKEEEGRDEGQLDRRQGAGPRRRRQSARRGAH